MGFILSNNYGKVQKDRLKLVKNALVLRNKLDSSWLLLLIGFLIRLALAPFTSHPMDIASSAVMAEWAYIFDFNPLYHNARSGIFAVGARILGYPVHMLSSWLGFGSILTLQLALKLPYIIADIGIAALLYRIIQFKTENRSIGHVLCFAWLVNPFAIFASSIHGTPDPLPVFFTLLAVYFLLKNKPVHSFIGLSIAACLKYYALFLFPLFAFYLWRKSGLREKVLSIVSSIIVVGVNFAPVVLDPVLRGQLFRSMAYYSTGTIEMISRPWSLWHLLLSSGFLSHPFIRDYIFWLSFIPIYVLMVFFIHRDYKRRRLDDLRVIEYTAIILLLIPLLNPFSDPQWLLWGLPFLMYLSLVANRRVRLLGSLRVSQLVSLLWVLNLVIIIFNWYTNPIQYLITAYPQASQYLIPRMDYLATTFGIPYVFVSSVIIFALLTGRRPALEGVKLHGSLTVLQAVFRNWKAAAICTLILTSLFTTIGTVSQHSPPSDPHLREWAYTKIFSFEPVATASRVGGTVNEFTFDVDAVRFFTATTWEGARAYVRFIDLPPSALTTINGLNVTSPMFVKQDIPFPTWVAEGAEFIEIPNIKENLEETMMISVSLQEIITEKIDVKIILYFDLELVKPWWIR